jgi:RimJ/RimL family protein N-acetyltransferase
VLHTERLHIRKLTLEDAPFIYELLNSPGWLTYIGDRGVNDLKNAEAYIEERYFPGYINGLGNFLVTLKDSNKPIGSCGLYKRANLDHPDIGFAFLPEYLGKGYGYEASSAILEYAFTDLNLQQILGFTVDYNVASIKLLEKLGLKKVGTFQFEDDDEELLLFQITKEKN